ncbi:MAG: membrane integrity-associated transporter subunit PqiC [Gammaproteobacteria bacterium]|nr:membrane integrity-associated transporter subunit PqiC [Gammaproteobacteria bacterium]
MHSCLPIRRRLRLPGVLLVMAAFAGSCTLVDTKPASLPVYDLRLAGPESPGGEPVSWQLAIDEPIALEPVAGARIVTRTREGALGVLEGGRWAARAPELVQAVLVEGFARSGRITGATRLGSGAPGDCTLLTDLRVFEYHQARREVQLTLAASLACGPAGRIAAVRTFASTVAVQGRGLAPVVAAFQQAVDGVVPELVGWTLASGSAAPGRTDR